MIIQSHFWEWVLHGWVLIAVIQESQHIQKLWYSTAVSSCWASVFSVGLKLHGKAFCLCGSRKYAVEPLMRPSNTSSPLAFWIEKLIFIRKMLEKHSRPTNKNIFVIWLQFDLSQIKNTANFWICWKMMW